MRKARRFLRLRNLLIRCKFTNVHDAAFVDVPQVS